MRVEGPTVAAALAAVFAEHPALRGYLLDDQATLRRHVAIYLNGEPLRDSLRSAMRSARTTRSMSSRR
jgi:sulfur-carrier protein